MSDLRKVHLYKFPNGGGRLTEWGKKIRKQRIEKCTTLLDMARALNVECGYLSGVECGRKPQDPEFMKRCEDYLEALPVNEERAKMLKCAESDIEELRKFLATTPEEFKRQYCGNWAIEEAPKRDHNTRANNEATKMTPEERQRFDESFEKAFRNGDKYF